MGAGYGQISLAAFRSGVSGVREPLAPIRAGGFCFGPGTPPRWRCGNGPAGLSVNTYKSGKPLSRAQEYLNNHFVRGGPKRRGAAMVELGFALLPFLAISLAIIDFSVPIFIRTTLTHAVREGTRYGITYQTRPGKTHSQSIKAVVQEQSMGLLAGTTGLNKIHVRFYLPTTFAEQTGPQANRGGNIVEVTVEGYTWQYMVPLWRSGTPLAVHAASSDRLEMLPRSAPRPAP
jgi:Flp pilus assembly protein TadG